MTYKYVYLKLQTTFASIIAIIISILFIPFIQNQENVIITWNGYYLYNIFDPDGNHTNALEEANNFPNFILLPIWLGLLMVFFGHHFVYLINKIKFPIKLNRQGKRTNIFGGYLISIVSIIVILSQIILIFLSKKNFFYIIFNTWILYKFHIFLYEPNYWITNYT